MISYEHSIVIQAPLSRVFEYTADLRTMPDWLQGLVEVRDVIGTGEGQQCEWTFKMIGVLLRGQAVVVECVENETWTNQTIGMLTATWTSTFEPAEEGTKLAVAVEYALPMPVLGRLAEHLTVRRMQRDLGSSLLNLKELLEGS